MCLEYLRSQIFLLRNNCGSKRQASFSAKLSELSDALSKFGKAHPYALNEKRSEFIEYTKIFHEGAKGVPTTITNGHYLYRIQSVEGFLKTVQWNSRLADSEDPDEVWNKMRNDWRKTGNDWLNLRKYISGTYPASINDPDDLKWWNFAWWTTYDLSENPMLGATKIGMCSDWVNSRTIVLRIPINSIASAQIVHVPTIIDAFMQPIFYPVNEKPVPLAGITIDLSNDTLCEGVDEYIVKPVLAESIDIQPKIVDNEFVEKFGKGREENSRVLNALISYYQCL